MERRLPAPIVQNGHSADLTYTSGGMGTAGWYRASCACGWQAAWDEIRSPIDSPLETQGFAQEFLEQVKADGGLRAHSEKRIASGAWGWAHRTDAFRAVLQHVSYDRAVHQEAIVKSRDALVAQLETPDLDNLDNTVHRVVELWEDWRNQKELLKLLDSQAASN